MKGKLWLLLVLAGVCVPRLCGAAVTGLQWNFPLDQFPGTRFVVHVLTTQAHRPFEVERPLEMQTPQQCRQYPNPFRDATTLCGTVCLEPGDYSLSVVAIRGQERSADSNVVDLDLTARASCLPPPPTVPPPEPPKPTPPLIIAGVGTGVVATVAEGLLGPSGPGSWPSLVNAGCVDWKIRSSCLCGFPPHPCVVVTYSEPAYVVEIVKKPGRTLLPGIGDLVQTALQAVGIPSWGGGGAGATSGSGHTNLHYTEAHVYAFPQLLGGPCTGCLPSGLPALLYASELDSATWRTATAVGAVAAAFPVGVWGPLYPRGGHVVHGSEVIAGALAAVRAMDIARQPLGTPPQVEAHVVLAPALMSATCLQMAWPKQLPCMVPGTPPPLWETGTLSARGDYVYVVWRRWVCCVEEVAAACGIALPGIGGHGANFCPLP